MAFKRVRKAKETFKKYTAKWSPEVRKKYEDKYTEKGVFELREQTAQVRLLRPHISLSELDIFMVYYGTDREHAPFGELPSHGKVRF